PRQFFFFQAEDGIRDFHVTGVQTCALPIFTTGALVEHALQQLYGEETGDAVPREVLVPALPDPVEPVQEWLTGRRGANVSLRVPRSEEHTSELQSRENLVCRLLLEKKKS